MTIGDRIKAARKKAGLTQAKLSEISGVAAISIHQYEAGKRHPQLVQIQALSNALNVPMSYLMGDKENEMKRQTKYQPTEGGIPFVVLAESAAEQDAMQRLAAYEDTGLEPGEVSAAMKEVSAAMKDGTYAQFQEWNRAHYEGRLIVLPCKVGDTVWAVNTHGRVVQGVVESLHQNLVAGEPGAWVATAYYPLYNEELREIHADFLPMRKYHQFSDFGKTVFLTREEALAKERDE